MIYYLTTPKQGMTNNLTGTMYNLGKLRPPFKGQMQEDDTFEPLTDHYSQELHDRVVACMSYHPECRPHTISLVGSAPLPTAYPDQIMSISSTLKSASKQSLEVLGYEYPSTLIDREKLAWDLCSQHKYKLAEEIFQQVLKTHMKTLGPAHPAALSSLLGLAQVFDKQGRCKEAEELFEQVLATRREVLGPAHPDTLSSKLKLAQVFEKQGRYKKAEELFEQVLATRREVLGPAHPDTLSSKLKLAQVFEKQGRYKKAEELFEQVLATRREVLGPAHPDTLSSKLKLAQVFEKQGRYKKAEELFEQVLATRRKVLGLQHPDTLSSMLKLAQVLEKQGRYKEAVEMFEKVLASSREVLGAEHPDTLSSMHRLAGILETRNIHRAAEEMRHQALKLAAHTEDRVVAELLQARGGAEVERKDKDRQYQDSTHGETDYPEDLSAISDDSSTSLIGSNPTSATSINILGGSVEELAELLLRDSNLGSLLASLQETVNMVVLEKNLSRLLERFGINLLAEALGNSERLVAQFVKKRATKVANRVRWKLDPVRDKTRNEMRSLSAQDTASLSNRRTLGQMLAHDKR